MGAGLLRGTTKFDMYSLCKERLASSGLSIQQVFDPEAARIRLSALSKTPSRPASSVLENDFTEENSFFVFFQSEGKDVGCVSTRMDNIGSKRFEDFWAALVRRLYTDREDFPVDTNHRLPFALTGKIVYIGDMYLDPEYRGLDNLHLRAALYAIYLLALDQWPDLDGIYALFIERFANEGYLTTYLASESVMAPQLFSQKIEGRDDSDWLSVMWPDRLMYWSELFLSRPDLFDGFRTKVTRKRSG